MSGKFEVYQDKAGEYRFRLKAANGEIILTSEGYKAKASAEHGIASVKQNAVLDERFEKKEAGTGKYMFNLKAKNGEVIGTSQLYQSTAARDKGIVSVRNNAPNAQVLDLE